MMIRRCRKFLRDLFCGHGNKFWELGRILTALFGLAMLVATAWNAGLGEPIDLGPNGLGGGLAAVLTAGAALIAAKDWLRSKSPPPEE